jgi:molecular chaperone DnaK (HSP70)
VSEPDDDAPSGYVVGIDLGTTHCALSYVDAELSEGDAIASWDLEIAQLVAPGQVDARALLPSFLYLPHPSELTDADRTLPWPSAGSLAERSFIVGELARTQGSKTPARLVASAKSWLCHAGIDRRGPVLPVDAPAEVRRISPLDATVAYLEHLRAAWDRDHPEAPLAAQDVTLAVPASFDPAARELTAEAARRAGLTRVVLLEEPQAALYAWLARSEGSWRREVTVGDVILVVDVGGGTTDFSLISVRETDGALTLERVAVGEHILLGGDNMDLALAHLVRQKLEAEGKVLDTWQLVALAHGCRAAKEALLSDDAPESVPVVVPSRGSRLVASSLRTELTRAEVTRVVLDGFFPPVDGSARPAQRARAGLTQLGLPYAQDAAVTRHLAAFLARQAHTTSPTATFARPTAVLFNGGVVKSALLRARILEVLGGWLTAVGAPAPRELTGADLDLAVARGAAYHAYTRRGGGVRIRGGTARAYYVGVESATPAVPGLEPPICALCVAPFGMEEGARAALLSDELGLVVGEPVRFRFFGSSVRRDDAVGTVLERWSDGELEELAELEAELPTAGRTPGEIVAVRLQATVSEVGVLELDAVPRQGQERWKLSLDVRHEVA